MYILGCKLLENGVKSAAEEDEGRLLCSTMCCHEFPESCKTHERADSLCSSDAFVGQVDQQADSAPSDNVSGPGVNKDIARLTKTVNQLQAQLQYQSSVQCSMDMKIWNLKRYQKRNNIKKDTLDLDGEDDHNHTDEESSSEDFYWNEDDDQMGKTTKTSKKHLENRLRELEEQHNRMCTSLEDRLHVLENKLNQQGIETNEKDNIFVSVSTQSLSRAHSRESASDVSEDVDDDDDEMGKSASKKVLKQRLRELEEERNTICTNMNTIRLQSKHEMDQHLKSCKSEIQSLEDRLKNAINGCKQLKQISAESEQQQKVIDEIQAQLVRQKQSFEARLRNADEERAKLNATLAITQQSLSVSETERTKLVQKMENIKMNFDNHIKSCSSQKKSLKDRLQQSTNECQQLNKQLKSAEKERDKLKSAMLVTKCSKCNNNTCDLKSAIRISCPSHAKCTHGCRIPIDDLTYPYGENGLLLCQICLPLACEHCKCFLTGDCVVYKKKLLHKYCHTIVLRG